MIISIVYILSVIILFYQFINLKKSKEKFNIIFSIVISLLLFFCYNSLIGYILNIFYIPINLISLSVVNIIISIFIIIYKRKHDEKQKYKFEKKDLLVSLILLLIVILIGIFRFGIPFEIVYETSDPGVHFWTSLDFYRHSSLLNHVVEPVVDFSTRQFASYLNVGILFKVASPFVGESSLYVIYILFDLFMLFLSGMLFYILIRTLCKNLNSFFILCASVLYMIGYPLNNMIFGFFYSGHAINIIILIVLFMYVHHKKLINNKMVLFYLMLLNIGLFFTYYFYTPVIFVSMFLFFIYENKKNKQKLIDFSLVKTMLIILFIPCLLGVLYFIIPNINNPEMNFLNQINLDGYFYNDVISNFIIFIPFVLYYILNNIKKKKLNFDLILTLVLFTTMIAFTIIIFLDLAVFYYLSKFYYLLWFIMFYMTLKVLNKLINENKMLVSIYSMFYLFIFVFSVFNIENSIIQKNKYNVNKRQGSNLLDIYYYNFDKIENSDVILTNDELKMIKEIYKLKPTDVVTNNPIGLSFQRIWINAFFKKTPVNYPENQLYSYMLNEYSYDPMGNSFETINKNYSYYLIFYRGIDFSNYEYGGDNIAQDSYNKIINSNNSERYIDYKDSYLKISRDTCQNCKFYDYDAGLLIRVN